MVHVFHVIDVVCKLIPCILMLIQLMAKQMRMKCILMARHINKLLHVGLL